MYAIYGNIYHQYTPNVSIYIPYMDPMGNIYLYIYMYIFATNSQSFPEVHTGTLPQNWCSDCSDAPCGRRKNATTIPNQQCSLMFAISTIHFDTSCSIHWIGSRICMLHLAIFPPVHGSITFFPWKSPAFHRDFQPSLSLQLLAISLHAHLWVHWLSHRL